MSGKYLEISPPVTAALNAGITVVALESGSFCSRPYPENLRRMQALEQAVWQQNCIPAYLALVNGKLKVGLTPADEDALMRQGAACSRAELPAAVARRLTLALLPSAALAAAALAELTPVIIPVLHDELADLDALALYGRLVFCAPPSESAAALFAARSIPFAQEALAAEAWLAQRALGSPESVICPVGQSAVSLAVAACRVAMEVRKKLEYDSHQRPGETRRGAPPLCVTCPTALELRRRLNEEAAVQAQAAAREVEQQIDIYEVYSRKYPVELPEEEPPDDEEGDSLPPEPQEEP